MQWLFNLSEVYKQWHLLFLYYHFLFCLLHLIQRWYLLQMMRNANLVKRNARPSLIPFEATNLNRLKISHLERIGIPCSIWRLNWKRDGCSVRGIKQLESHIGHKQRASRRQGYISLHEKSYDHLPLQIGTPALTLPYCHVNSHCNKQFTSWGQNQSNGMRNEILEALITCKSKEIHHNLYL